MLVQRPSAAAAPNQVNLNSLLASVNQQLTTVAGVFSGSAVTKQTISGITDYSNQNALRGLFPLL